MALMQGFAAARGDVAIMMDADLQDEPENIPAMLTKLSEGYDLVNGYRADRKDTRLKRLVSRVFNIITTHLFKTDVHDINCGFKVIRRDLYKMLELRGDLHRLIPALASGYGFKVAEVEVTHVDRKHGSSKYKLLRHRGLLDIIALMAALTTRYRPFHVFCEIALILWALVLCDLVGIIILAKRSVSSAALLGDTAFIILAFVGLVLMLSGIVLPVVGLILDILSAPQQDARWRGTLVCKQALPETK
jgi:glycosyltransferase involved in cell wall biosynthesis